MSNGTNHTPCPYCAGATSDSIGKVYCSRAGHGINDLESSLFSYTSSNLESEPHFTRLTLRFVSEGAQRYTVGKNEKVVVPGKYLLMNHGQQYRTFMPPGDPTSMVGIAFKPSYVAEFVHDLTHNENHLLDNPCINEAPYPALWEGVYEADGAMQHIVNDIQLLLRTKNSLSKKDKLDTFYSNVLAHIFRNQAGLLQESSRLSSIRPSTAQELYRRLLVARDYLDANFYHVEMMSAVARVACLSEFHFMRSFRKVFGVSPYQYVIRLRMENAKTLLLKNNRPIKEVSLESGFVNAGDFSRLFKKTFGTTPGEARSYSRN